MHLVNLTPGISFGASSEVFYDEVPTYRNINLIIRPPHQPSNLTLLPGDIDLIPSVESSECEDPQGHCTLKITVPELTYHVAIRLADAIGETTKTVH